MKIQDMLYVLWKKITDTVLGIKILNEKEPRTGVVNLDLNTLGYLGANITRGKANDTDAFWRALPSGGVYFNQNDYLNGQPAQFGMLHHYNLYPGYMSQTYSTANGFIHTRHSNGSTSQTFSDWRVFLYSDGSVPITGNLKYNNSIGNKDFIQFKPNPTGNTGNGLLIGNGGLTILGGGKAHETVYAKLVEDGYGPGTKSLFLASDGGIFFRTGLNSGYTSSVGESGISTDGHFFCKPKILTTTYTQNDYVNETAFNRIKVRKVGNFVIVFGELQITTTPVAATSITIGKINNMGTCVQNYAAQVPVCNGGSLNITVTTAGEIKIYAYTKDAPLIGNGTWARFNAVLIVTN